MSDKPDPLLSSLHVIALGFCAAALCLAPWCAFLIAALYMHGWLRALFAVIGFGGPVAQLLLPLVTRRAHYAEATETALGQPFKRLDDAAPPGCDPQAARRSIKDQLPA